MSKQPIRSLYAALVLWALLIGLHASGFSVAQRVAFDASVRQRISAILGPTSANPASRVSSGASFLKDAVRRYFTDDDDMNRYRAYVRALRGQSYSTYFVRSIAAFKTAFLSGATEPDADDAIAWTTETPPRALLPYRDYAVEYPPGFFFFALPPALLANSERGYQILFVVEMGLLLLGSLFLTRYLQPALAPAAETTQMVRMTVLATLLLGTVVTHRYDAALAFLIVAAGVAAIRERPVWLGSLAALAVVTKGVPLLLAPLWGIYLLNLSEKGPRRAIGIRRLASAVTAGIVVALPLLWLAGSELLSALRYHAERPIQIESTWGALSGLFSGLCRASLPSPVHVVFTYGSFNVIGPGAPALVALSTVALIGGSVAIYMQLWQRLQRGGELEERAEALHAATVLLLVLYMVVGKVFSPQYLVWLLPMGLWLSLRRHTVRLFLVVLGLTQIVYPFCYPLLRQLEPLLCGLVVIRNGLLFYWAWRSAQIGRSAAGLHRVANAAL